MRDYYQGFTYASVRARILTVKSVWEVSAWPDCFLLCVGAYLQLCMETVYNRAMSAMIAGEIAARGCFVAANEKVGAYEPLNQHFVVIQS